MAFHLLNLPAPRALVAVILFGGFLSACGSGARIRSDGPQSFLGIDRDIETTAGARTDHISPLRQPGSINP